VLDGWKLTTFGPAEALATPLADYFGGPATSRDGAAVAVTTIADAGLGIAILPSVPPMTRSPGPVPVYAASALLAGGTPTPALMIDPAAVPQLAGVVVG
jgi:hypothetical protein